MVRRMLATLATLFAAVVVCAVPANAAFHYENVDGFAIASWDSCQQVAVGAPCAFTEVQAETEVTDVYDGSRERDCLFMFQSRGVKLGDYAIQAFDHTEADACGAANVIVDASLTGARIRGAIPAQNCHFDLATGVETCTPSTALELSLDWEGTGDIVRYSPLTYRYSYEPGQRCLFHATPGRYRLADASGEIAGLPAPLGEPRHDITSLAFGGAINVGTDFGCYD